MARMGIRRSFFDVLAILLLHDLISISAFNIDTQAPILKSGPAGSYFGYQVTFHIKEEETIILVGAPKDNTTYNNHRATSGSVYECKYDSSGHCAQVDMREATKKMESDGIWIGGTLASQVEQDGKALICAHRYKKKDWGEGICFSMDSNLEYQDGVSPCGGDSEKDLGHEQFGFCQAGTSAELTKHGDVVIGIPGAYLWRGGVTKRYYPTSLEDDGDESQFMSQVKDQQAPIKPYSYLGMSVKTGHLLADPKKLTYIGGAPRSFETGEVILFEVIPSDKHLHNTVHLIGEQFGSYFGSSLAVVDVNNDGLDDLVVGAPFYRDKWLGGAAYLYLNVPKKGIMKHTKPQKLTPELLSKSDCFQVNCINAQFGHSLAAIGDINLDGFQDLAIGAPYEAKGVVYIYKGGVEGLKLTQKIQQANFKNMPETFGISIYGGGIDLDGNGYPDLVIGSHKSSKISILRTRPIVVVSHIIQAIPNIIDPSITSCHKNNYQKNCLEIRVCFMLDKPKIKSQRKDIVLSYNVEAEKFTGRSMSRVFFDKTKSYEMKDNTMTVGESQSCKELLVYINDNIRDFLNPIPFRLTYHIRDMSQPSQHTDFNIPNLDDFPIMDQTASNETIMLHFKKNCGDDSVCRSNLKLQASLKLPRNAEGVYRLRVGIDKEVVMMVVVENLEEDAHETTFYMNLTNNILLKGVDSESGEIVCDINQQQITCNLGNPLKGRARQQFGIRLNTERATPTKETVSIVLSVNTTSDETDISDNHLDLKLEIKVETDIGIRGSSVPASVFYSGVVKGESAVVDEDDIGLEVKHSYEIKNIGNATVSASKVIIHWPYELSSKHPHGKHLLYIMDPPMADDNDECLYDPDIVNPLKVKVDYSKRLQTKHQFYRQSRRASLQGNNNNNNNGGDDDDNGGDDNDNGGDDDDARRTKREAPSQSALRMMSGSHVKLLDCDDGSAKCHQINCTLGKLRQGQSIVIRIRARLWNSTFIEEFKDWDRVDISSKAQVFIDPSLNIEQTNLQNDVLKIVTSVQPEFKETRGVAWWVILLAILIGVILLIALILLLWKCGFFKRNRGAHMTSHKAEMLKKEYDE